MNKDMVSKRRTSSRRVPHATDKWKKTNILLHDQLVRHTIPRTRIWGKKAFIEMMERYQMVYVKPVFGSMGRGVIRVKRVADTSYYGSSERYEYQVGSKRREFHSLDGIYQALTKEISGKSYLIQQGIQLLTYQNRAYDFRIVVQRSPQGKWEVTGTVARIASPGKIVTNGSQGGTILPAQQVLQPYMHPQEMSRHLARLETISLRTVRLLHKKYPSLKEYGLDVAVDHEFKPWILEVNTKPDHCPFAILDDQSMINKIVYYGRQYGREYRLNCNKAKTTM